MDAIQKSMLEKIADLHEVPEGAIIYVLTEHLQAEIQQPI